MSIILKVGFYDLNPDYIRALIPNIEILSGKDIEECAQAGLIISSFIWEVTELQEGMPDKEAFNKRYEREFREKPFP